MTTFILVVLILILIIGIVKVLPVKKYVITYREELMEDRFIVVFEIRGILGIHGEKIEFINWDDEWDRSCIEKALNDSKQSGIPYKGPNYF
jgi:hypothetical protein